MAADAETGRQIFEQWCTSCHASKTADKAGDAAPPLSAIVNAPTLSEGNMKVWLANPHPPMPNLSLGKLEIDNLVAYFKSLRKE